MTNKYRVREGLCKGSTCRGRLKLEGPGERPSRVGDVYPNAREGLTLDMCRGEEGYAGTRSQRL